MENKGNKQKIGNIRYSSSNNNKHAHNAVVNILPDDFIGKRTALFGMTRTGKSNTIKKIIQLSKQMSIENNPIGQIIFDMNGEYANINKQDNTSIKDLYKEDTLVYSTFDYQKEDIRILKTNFYEDLLEGWNILNEHFKPTKGVDYINSFLAIDMAEHIENIEGDDYSLKTRSSRVIAAYKCCLHKAGFKPLNEKIYFDGKSEVDKECSINPKKWITYDKAIEWFEELKKIKIYNLVVVSSL